MEQINSRSYTGFEGLKLSADVGGPANAPPVILLHGGGQTRHSWGGAMRELIRRGYHVISLDARGHGQSQWSDSGNYSLESFSGDLLAVIRSLSAPPVIVGASMGGATGLHLLGNQPPELAAGLVLVDVVPRMERKGAEKIGRFMRGNPDGFANLEEAAEAVAAYNPHRPRPKDPEGLKKNLRQRNGRLVLALGSQVHRAARIRRTAGFHRAAAASLRRHQSAHAAGSGHTKRHRRRARHPGTAATDSIGAGIRRRRRRSHGGR